MGSLVPKAPEPLALRTCTCPAPAGATPPTPLLFLGGGVDAQRGKQKAFASCQHGLKETQFFAWHCKRSGGENLRNGQVWGLPGRYCLGDAQSCLPERTYLADVHTVSITSGLGAARKPRNGGGCPKPLKTVCGLSARLQLSGRWPKRLQKRSGGSPEKNPPVWRCSGTADGRTVTLNPTWGFLDSLCGGNPERFPDV